MSKVLHIVAFTLVTIGALNWGLVGLLNFNLVEMILGALPWLERLVYILVGVSGIVLAATHMKDCRICGTRVPHASAGMSPTPPAA